jgi:hypothetical protein
MPDELSDLLFDLLVYHYERLERLVQPSADQLSLTLTGKSEPAMRLVHVRCADGAAGELRIETIIEGVNTKRCITWTRQAGGDNVPSEIATESTDITSFGQALIIIDKRDLPSP